MASLAGDINDDGFGDMLFVASAAEAGGTARGDVYLVYGGGARHCLDGVQDADELGSDIGGSCAPQYDGASCFSAGDCQSGSCSGTCQATGSLCGNGSPDVHEACDVNGANNDVTPDTCRMDCRLPGCGDGVIDAGEDCDDGAANGYGGAPCPLDCQIPFCGDGTQDIGEECDDGNAEPGDGCDANCSVEYCGDRVWQWELGEQCDGADGLDIADCIVGSTPHCDNECIEICGGPFCGNGIRDMGEDCDDGNEIPGDGCTDCVND